MRNALLALVLVCASPCAATAQIAILHIRVIEGERAVHRAGSRVLHPLTVEVTDETGRPQPGIAVSFHMPDDGPGGTCGNGLRTDVVMTDQQGHASLKSLQLNHLAGPFRIRIIAAKDEARAGIVSLQYIADPKGVPGSPAIAGVGSKATPVKTVQRRSHKWLVVALVAAGVAAGGLGAGLAGGKSSASAAPTVAAVPITIGTPTISVGKP